MGSETAIEWTHATWNPHQGCTKVSPGCKNCYMYREKTRYGQDPTQVARSSDATFYGPRSRRRYRPGSLVFTCSWSDFFHEAADEWRAEEWGVIRFRDDLIFQVLTKRDERIGTCLPEDWGERGYDNVWLGVSVENADQLGRVEALRRVPAVVRFVSAEPLLGSLAGAGGDWGWLDGIDWVIVGGESGPGARPMHPQWVREIRDACRARGVAVLFKQWGEWAPAELSRPRAEGALAVADDPTSLVERVGKKAAGRALDGETLDGYPSPAGWTRGADGYWTRAAAGPAGYER